MTDITYKNSYGVDITVTDARDIRLSDWSEIGVPPTHDWWMAGAPDCPKDIKTGNGELHTLRCKRCGLDNPRDKICRVA